MISLCFPSSYSLVYMPMRCDSGRIGLRMAEVRYMTGQLQALLTMSPQEKAQRGLLFTPKEIAQQPGLWMETSRLLKDKSEEIRAFLSDIISVSRAIDGPKVTFVLSGAGSSEFAGRAVERFFKMAFSPFGVDTRSVPSTDIVTDPSWSLPLGDIILVSFARSGDSPESVAAYKACKKARQGMRAMTITCNPKGRLARLAEGDSGHMVLTLPELTNDQGLAMTSSFSSMVVAAQQFAYLATGNPEGYPGMLDTISRSIERDIEILAGYASDLAQRGLRRAVFIGDGDLYGIALECSLKLQEMSSGKTICKAETTLGLRHGPMAVIDDETLVVYLTSNSSYLRNYQLDLMSEIKMKGLGGRRVALCGENWSERLSQVCDIVIDLQTPDITDSVQGLGYVVFGQLLGLFASINLGLRPDNPSEDGVISRVVQGVKIYETD